MENESVICKELYKVIVRQLSLNTSDNAQVHKIWEANGTYDNDVLRLCVIEPYATLFLEGKEFFRIKRIVEPYYINNFDSKLKELGVNVFCNFDYSTSMQDYRVYYRGFLISVYSCPPTVSSIIGDIISDTWVHDKNEVSKRFSLFVRKLNNTSEKFARYMSILGS